MLSVQSVSAVVPFALPEACSFASMLSVCLLRFGEQQVYEENDLR